MAPALGRDFTAGSETRRVARQSAGTNVPMNKKLQAEIIRSCNEKLVVPIEDGLYHEEWLWFPDLPAGELEAWWSGLDNVETFWSERGRANWPGSFVRVDDDLPLSDLWQSIWNTGAYRARIEFNQPLDSAGPGSYLRKSDGTVLLHQGAISGRELDSAATDE